MKLNLAIPGLLIALLVGCNDTTTRVEPPVSPTPTSTNSPNPFDSDSFPKAGCGDTMPTDKKTDTIKLYPVFVDYSDSNLQTIKANYCGDALKITTKDKGKYVIQVASFTSEERANQFKEFLARKLGSTSVEVGEATVIGAKPIPKSTKNVAKATEPTGDQESQDKKADSLVGADNSPYAIGKAAKLTSAQIKELIEMEKHKSYIRSGTKEVKSRFVVPTYIPPGFQVSGFRTADDDNHGGLRYRIDYCNSSKFCFAVAGGIQHEIGDEPLSFEMVKNISSPALGKVELGYANYDGTNNKPYIAFTGAMNRFVKDNNFYVFLSAGGYLNPDDQTISLNEANKIVESLQYLNR
jgi:SPOR domain